MILPVLPLAERAVADGARIGPVSTVSPHVSFKVHAAGKLLAARTTFKLKRVGMTFDVERQCPFVFEPESEHHNVCLKFGTCYDVFLHPTECKFNLLFTTCLTRNLC